MTTVRALFQAAKVESAAPPYDTLHLKVFYPAQSSGSAQEQDLGIVWAAPAMGSLPKAASAMGWNGKLRPPL